MKNIIVFFLKIYKIVFSPLIVSLIGHGCRYEQSCSEYSLRAIEKFGLLKGTQLALKRVSHCHPFSKNIDYYQSI
jgi:hypothetical protein